MYQPIVSTQQRPARRVTRLTSAQAALVADIAATTAALRVSAGSPDAGDVVFTLRSGVLTLATVLRNVYAGRVWNGDIEIEWDGAQGVERAVVGMNEVQLFRKATAVSAEASTAA